MQWASLPQLHKYGGPFISFYLLQQTFEIAVPDFPLAAALHLQSTQSTELVNCSFYDHMATALVVDNTSITLAGKTNFTHNHELCGSITGGSNIKVGGGITAFDSHLTFRGNTTFLENNPSCSAPGGGAICTSGNTVLNFNGASNFNNNSAHGLGVGGAIYTSGNTVLSFNGAMQQLQQLSIWS